MRSPSVSCWETTPIGPASSFAQEQLKHSRRSSTRQASPGWFLLPDCYRAARHGATRDGTGRQSPGPKVAQDGTPRHRTTQGDKPCTKFARRGSGVRIPSSPTKHGGEVTQGASILSPLAPLRGEGVGEGVEASLFCPATLRETVQLHAGGARSKSWEKLPGCCRHRGDLPLDTVSQPVPL